MTKALITCFFLFLTGFLKAQEFINGDLEGTITGTASLPDNWFIVPYFDINCMASAEPAATPDLTDTSELAVIGGNGIPYSGSTFLSGLYGQSSNLFFQEGIMQSVPGFTIGHSYNINFYQAVIKQVNARDSSGAWNIYIDDLSAGTTSPSFSDLPYDDIHDEWQFRSVQFTATQTVHLIKFLPVDDDSLNNADFNTNIRMGIDSIYITEPDTLLTGFNELKEKFLLYPNPATDFFTINLTEPDAGTFSVFDISGRIIYSVDFRDSATINCGCFNSGIYFYEIYTLSGKIKSGKFIKSP